MKIVLWTAMAGVGLILAACGPDQSVASLAASTNPSSGGSSAPSSSSPSSSSPTSSSPTSSAPSDFVQFVDQQIGSEPAFGSAPAATTSLTTDLALGTAGAFAATPFGTGDAVPTGTYQASVACTAAGKTACNPGVSADLNSTLN
jgi:hypothetical protein